MVLIKKILSIAMIVLFTQGPFSATSVASEPVRAEKARAGAKIAPDKVRPTRTAHTKLRLTALSYTGIGPLLSAVRVQLAYKSVYKRSSNPILDGLYGQAVAGLTMSPSMVGLKVEGEWLPLAILRLRASYTAQYYTGYASGLGHGLAFIDADSAYDAATLDDRTGEEQADLSHRALFMLTFRLKLGRFILFSDNEFAGWYYPKSSGNEYAYETFYDGLIRRGAFDGTYMNRTAILFEAWKGKGTANFRLGAVNQYVRTFSTGAERLRTGAILLWTPREKLWGMKDPTFVVMSGTTVDHRYRRGDFWAEIILVLNWDLKD